MLIATVVNVIPYNRSDETNQDCMPFLAVNPANPSLMIATASTYDNPQGTSARTPQMTGYNVPIYVSSDGGNTWSLKDIMMGSSPGTPQPSASAISVGFGAHGNFYAAVNGPSYGPFPTFPDTDFMQTQINSSPGDWNDPLNEILWGYSGYFPYLQAGIQSVKVWRETAQFSNAFIAYSDDTGSSASLIPMTVLNAAIGVFPNVDDQTPVSGGKAPFSFFIDFRKPPMLDFAARVAVHSDGTVYGAFYRSVVPSGSSITQIMQADVIMVRDHGFALQGSWGDNFGAFKDLTDPSDGLPGRIVVSGIYIPFSGQHLADFGQERLAGGDIAIAVDPGNSQNVYMAYGDGTGASDYTIHLINSTDGGNTWSADLRTLTSAKNIALAVNSVGQVGFFYQQLQDGNWLTTCEISGDNFTSYDPFVLANVPASTPPASPIFGPYLADYANLVTVGEGFCGIFCANNTPNMNNFPSGVTYQRNANFTTQQLLDQHNNVVAPSIDPFFFTIVEEKFRPYFPAPFPILPEPIAGPITPAPGTPVEDENADELGPS